MAQKLDLHCLQAVANIVGWILKRAPLVTDDLIIYVFQPSSRPYSDQLIVVVPHTQPSLPIPMDLSIAIDIHTARILRDII